MLISMQEGYWTFESQEAIDLIHDSHRLCTSLRTDGMKAMSHGFSGDTKTKKNANSIQQWMNKVLV